VHAQVLNDLGMHALARLGRLVIHNDGEALA
jgi:hypothetical protein